MGVAWRFTVKESVDIESLEAETSRYLQELNVKQFTKHIDAYQHAIAKDASYNTQLVNFYEQTGIKSTQ